MGAVGYKLVKVIDGKIIDNEQLRNILFTSGFTIPTLPPMLTPVRMPLGSDYPSTPEGIAQFNAAFQEWNTTFAIPDRARLLERTNKCADFALVLRQEFKIALRRRTSIKLVDVDRYLSFAILLTELHFPWKFKQDKMDWITYECVN